MVASRATYDPPHAIPHSPDTISLPPIRPQRVFLQIRREQYPRRIPDSLSPRPKHRRERPYLARLHELVRALLHQPLHLHVVFGVESLEEAGGVIELLIRCVEVST